MLGGASGLLVTHAVLPVLGLIARGDRWSVPRIEQVGVDPRVLGFCILSVLVWVLILGTVPSWGRRPVSIETVLRHGTKTSRGRQTVLRSLATNQIALTVMVVTGAALLTQSFGNLRAIDRGFNPDNLAVLGLSLPEARYPTSETRLAFYDQLIQRVETLPDVVSAAPFHLRPGTGGRGIGSRLVIEGQTRDDAVVNPMASLEIAWPSHFRTLGIPIVQGWGFTEADTRDAMRVAIVSESTATRYWPGERALGRRLHIGGDAPWATVVGVAGDLRYSELTRDWLTVYFPGSASVRLLSRRADGANGLGPGLARYGPAERRTGGRTSGSVGRVHDDARVGRPRTCAAASCPPGVDGVWYRDLRARDRRGLWDCVV